MNFRPTRGNIIVSLNAKQKKTDGGILLPDTVRNHHREATVVSVSEGNLNMDGTITPHEVKEGDKVVIRSGENLGNEIELGGTKCYLITDKDIIAIIEEGE